MYCDTDNRGKNRGERRKKIGNSLKHTAMQFTAIIFASLSKIHYGKKKIAFSPMNSLKTVFAYFPKSVLSPQAIMAATIHGRRATSSREKNIFL